MFELTADDRNAIEVGRRGPQGDMTMLWTLIVLLLAFWALGLVAHVGGGLIHLLLVVAVVVFVFNLLTGRRTAV
jgi:hypothetical protein